MVSIGLRLVIIGLAAVLATGCSRLRDGWQGFWGAERVEKPAQTAAAPDPDAPPPEAPPPEPTPQSAAAVPEPEPKQRPMIETRLEPPPATRLSERLTGLDFDAMRGLLGEPAAIKEVPPGQEWLYRDGECALAIRFFPEMEKLHYRALSVSVHDEGQTDGDQYRCHERFIARLKF
ncbi:MAG: hypothetical protein DCC73_01445 [Proteobacteria bacterium]|nr:MAG: hypothetical protein DCC73_01445 [Pseudomonadota bacterium]